MTEKKHVFTVPEAARYCSVDRVTLWRWVKSGNIKAWRTPGGHHRIAKEDLEVFIREKGISSEHFTQSGKRILIVDDDPTVQKALTKLLRSYGFITEIASDGFNAGIKVMRFKPDLIILDLIMPGMDGFDVCRHVKNNPATAHIKILSLTGYDTEENRKRILEAGADCTLTKPADEDVLLDKIHKLTNNFHAHNKNVKSFEKK